MNMRQICLNLPCTKFTFMATLWLLRNQVLFTTSQGDRIKRPYGSLERKDMILPIQVHAIGLGMYIFWLFQISINVFVDSQCFSCLISSLILFIFISEPGVLGSPAFVFSVEPFLSAFGNKIGHHLCSLLFMDLLGHSFHVWFSRRLLLLRRFSWFGRFTTHFCWQLQLILSFILPKSRDLTQIK